MNYYNEFDPKAAAWLRQLIADGLIPQGEVDERSIEDVSPADLRGYTQCHFFAGIGGWPYALALAGWPSDRPVWTGSCPCQPFSSAGQGAGFADERHLWPAFFHLIQQCQPATVFGEQVASRAGLSWLDLVSDDLEGQGYSFGAADLCAAGVGAPHIRQRLFWVANGNGARQRASCWPVRNERDNFGGGGEAGGVGDTSSSGLQERVSDRPVQCGTLGAQQGQAAERGSDASWLANTDGADASAERQQHGGQLGLQPAGSKLVGWSDCDWLPCSDGKSRPVEPSSFPLAHGVPARVVRIRGYGNAIVPQVAAEFVRAVMT